VPARILPELEAYRDRLEERCRAWDETGDGALEADLTQCREQIRLLQRRLAELEKNLGLMPESAAEEQGRVRKRIAVLEQTRDLTGAYAHVLEAYRRRRAQA